MTTSLGQCPSCGAPKQGAYCAYCGERFLKSTDFDLRQFLLHDLPHDLWHVEGKLKRTLRALLLKPGLLPIEYCAGRRVAYVTPLRLYLVVFLLHLTIVATSPDGTRTLLDHAANIDPTGLTLDLARVRPEVHWSDPALQERLAARGRWGAEIGTMLIFLGVAVVLKVLFYRQRRRYLAHAILALSVTTWYLLLISVGEFALTLTRARQFAEFDLKLAEWLTPVVAVYGWFALRRFYGASRSYATLATVVLFFSQALIAIAMNIAVVALLIVTA